MKDKLRNHTYSQQLLFIFRKPWFEHQLSLPHVTHNTLLLGRTRIWGTIKPLLGNGSSGAVLHHSRARRLWRTFPHTQRDENMEDLWSDFQRRYIRRNLDILACLQSEDTLQLNSSGNDIQTYISVPQFHEELQSLYHRHLVNSQQGKKHTSTTLFTLQGAMFHCKNSNCIWWNCQDF